MSSNLASGFDLTTLRDVKAELRREIQQLATQEGPSNAPAGFAVMSWSRASITHYAEELDRLEAMTAPTAEDRKVMQELNQVTLLLDQLVAMTAEQGVMAPSAEALGYNHRGASQTCEAQADCAEAW